MNAQRIVQNCVLKNQSTVVEEMIQANLIFLEYLDPFADEVLEWWLIDSWLAERLQQEDEVVIEEYGCYWWGRSTSGQAIYLDSVNLTFAPADTSSTGQTSGSTEKPSGSTGQTSGSTTEAPASADTGANESFVGALLLVLSAAAGVVFLGRRRCKA